MLVDIFLYTCFCRYESSEKVQIQIESQKTLIKNFTLRELPTPEGNVY